VSKLNGHLSGQYPKCTEKPEEFIPEGIQNLKEAGGGPSPKLEQWDQQLKYH